MKLRNSIQHFLRSRPPLYDATLWARRQLGNRPPLYRFLHSFSLFHDKKVAFVQIGASDGLRSDPIREFIIRDRWSGLLVEPLPAAFEQLVANYSAKERTDLVFVNAAVSSDCGDTIAFWTFDEASLGPLTAEEKYDLLRKSSVHIEHVRGYSTTEAPSRPSLLRIEVPCMSLPVLMDRYWHNGELNLLVIDAEGHESEIIPSIDCEKIRPETILFESHNLGSRKDMVMRYLQDQAYITFELGGDSVAVTEEYFREYRQVLMQLFRAASRSANP